MRLSPILPSVNNFYCGLAVQSRGVRIEKSYGLRAVPHHFLGQNLTDINNQCGSNDSGVIETFYILQFSDSDISGTCYLLLNRGTATLKICRGLSN